MDANILFWIALIALIIYYINKKYYWLEGVERIAEREAKEISKYTNQAKESVKSNGSEMSKKYEELWVERAKKFAEAHDNYLHLKEKYRNDSKRRQINSDYRVYLKATQDILDTEMDFGVLEGKLLGKAQDKRYKAEIALQEVERRFSDLLKAKKL